MSNHGDRERRFAVGEGWRLPDLEEEVSAWEKSRQIRAYARAVTEAAIRAYGYIPKGSDLDRWLRWANEQADRIDPIPGRLGNKR